MDLLALLAGAAETAPAAAAASGGESSSADAAARSVLTGLLTGVAQHQPARHPQPQLAQRASQPAADSWDEIERIRSRANQQGFQEEAQRTGGAQPYQHRANRLLHNTAQRERTRKINEQFDLLRQILGLPSAGREEAMHAACFRLKRIAGKTHIATHAEPVGYVVDVPNSSRLEKHKQAERARSRRLQLLYDDVKALLKINPQSKELILRGLMDFIAAEPVAFGGAALATSATATELPVDATVRSSPRGAPRERRSGRAYARAAPAASASSAAASVAGPPPKRQRGAELQEVPSNLAIAWPPFAPAHAPAG